LIGIHYTFVCGDAGAPAIQIANVRKHAARIRIKRLPFGNQQHGRSPGTSPLIDARNLPSCPVGHQSPLKFVKLGAGGFGYFFSDASYSCTALYAGIAINT